MEQAKEDFILISKMPETPPPLAMLASRVIANLDNPAMAMEFLEELLQQTTDPKVRKKLAKRMAQAQLAIHLEAITSATERFAGERGRYPTSVQELVQTAFLPDMPREPFGGSYEIDPGTGAVRTTSGKKPLAFNGKTARTGVASHEFNVKGE